MPTFLITAEDMRAKTISRPEALEKLTENALHKIMTKAQIAAKEGLTQITLDPIYYEGNSEVRDATEEKLKGAGYDVQSGQIYAVLSWEKK